MKTLTIIRKGEDKLIKVDDKYYDVVAKYKWHVDAWGYARRNYSEPGFRKLPGAKQGIIFMHNFLWFLETGEVYPQISLWSIDHKDRDTLNNQLGNLRKVSYDTQMRNRKMSNKTGYKGVYKKPNGKFQASIWDGKRNKSLGHFATAKEAHQVYVNAYIIKHGHTPV